MLKRENVVIIFHLISSIDKGGAETHLYSLIKKQVKEKKNLCNLSKRQ